VEKKHTVQTLRKTENERLIQTRDNKKEMRGRGERQFILYIHTIKQKNDRDLYEFETSLNTFSL
jgi:hypothetical protein